MRKLRIGMLASNFIRIPPIPPEKYVPPGGSGAPELITHWLTEELVRRGHKITLFASGNSKTSAKLISVTPEETWRTIGIGPHEEYERLLISHAYQQAQQGNFDIIHSHHDLRSIPFANLVSTPTVSTLHSPLDQNFYDILPQYKNSQYFVSISNSQRVPRPELKYIATVYNGIDTSVIPFNENPDNFLLFSGRIVESKGVVEAITVAKQSNHELRIFGSTDESTPYWREKINPHLNQETITYKGVVDRQELFKDLSQAKAFIFPIQWDEPFGLVMIEAMACGTPVIAFRRGAVSEVVIDGKTGFIVDTIEEMIAALKKVDQIDRRTCRAHVEKNFSVEKMVDGYEQAYSTILQTTSL
jgi:glycosyltransferase involved in cell wall biosynthesis